MLLLIERPMIILNALTVTLLLFTEAIAQYAPAEDAAKLQADYSTQTSRPTITFTLDWPSAQPPHYKLVLASDGAAEYASHLSSSSAAIPAADATNTASDSAIEESFTTRFAVSAAIRQRIFTLAQQANFFNGNFNYE